MNNKKTLIIDLDENKNINKILNLKSNREIFKEEKFNKNISVLNLNKKICVEKEAKKIVEGKLKNYEKIIMDTSNNSFEEIEKTADIYIFLIEPNITEINKSKKILEKYIYEYNIPKNKIKIIFNKINKYSIDYNILKNIFSEYRIIGKLKLNIKYNYLINKNIKIIDEEIKLDFLKIISKIKGV